jgi:uncharacterized protein (UPF0333 family)
LLRAIQKELMKSKLLLFCFSLVLIISLLSCSYPQATTTKPTENTVIETIKDEATVIETTAGAAEWFFYNYIVSMPSGMDNSKAEAFLSKEKLVLTANVTKLEQLKEQMPNDITLEITYNGPFQFCAFIFSDKSEIIFQFVQGEY